jgi:hypothetical protein
MMGSGKFPVPDEQDSQALNGLGDLTGIQNVREFGDPLFSLSFIISLSPTKSLKA